MNNNSILLVDDDAFFLNVLMDFFKDDFEVIGARSGEQALELLKDKQFDLLISDIIMPGIDGFELVNIVRSKYPETKIALITGYDIDEYIKLAKEKHVTNIIAKESPFNFDELSRTVHNLLTGDFFGLVKYFHSDAVTHSITVRDSLNIQPSIAQIISFFKHSQKCENKDILDICDLVIDELLFNAMIHAPKFDDGKSKYKKGDHVILADHETIQLDYGYDHQKLGVAVIDQFGSLENGMVLNFLHRHLAGNGYEDREGRGIFISRFLTDRFIINIKKFEKTEIIFLMYFSDYSDRIKPLCIYQI